MNLVEWGFLLSVFLLSLGLTRYLCSPRSPFLFLDHPNERSLHDQPRPRTGGIAILSSFILGIWLIKPQQSHWLTELLIFTLLLAVISLWDDRRGIPLLLRLGVHIAVAIGIACNEEFFVNKIPIPFGGEIALGWFVAPLTILYILWMTNLYNFMDGLDGLASGMTVIGFSMLGYFAWRGGNQTLAITAWTLVAASGAFLIFNFPPSKIFLGDVGSIPLGFLAGTLSLKAIHDHLLDFWVALLIFSLFIADATATLLLRLFRGEKFWQPHRKHFYQHLVLMGWGHRKTVFAEYTIMLITALSALFYNHFNAYIKFGLLISWFFIYISFFLYIEVGRREQK